MQIDGIGSAGSLHLLRTLAGLFRAPSNRSIVRPGRFCSGTVPIGLEFGIWLRWHSRRDPRQRLERNPRVAERPEE